MTEHARAVIIGGGVGGTSIAYHLTAKGWRDVVLLDRAELTSGSTFHSAGLVGQLRSSVALTRLMMWSVECYRRLGAETGHDPGWKEVGSLGLRARPSASWSTAARRGGPRLSACRSPRSDRRRRAGSSR
jgi:4-methylaminobutanoate oxidase (formaldehyde-forming)